jgi:tRNA(fMet)-specific endonuclease VapC
MGRSDSPYDEAAASVFLHLEPRLIRRIGAWDSRIASIALVHGATILTANKKDFLQVPGLNVENWLV